MGYVVLDTDVCSFLFKKDTRGERYRVHLVNQTLCLSFQTVAELYAWAELRNWGASRRAQLEQWLRNFVVLPYDNDTARAWARIQVERRQKPIGAADAWIAACAVRHDCSLITHNASDYTSISRLAIITES